MSCPKCTNIEQKYGFHLEKNTYYMTQLDEVKKCCPVKVFVTDFTSSIVNFIYNNKQYTKNKTEFYKSSWRLYESF